MDESGVETCDVIQQAFRSEASCATRNLRVAQPIPRMPCFRQGRSSFWTTFYLNYTRKKRKVLELYIILVDAFSFLTSEVPETFDEPTYFSGHRYLLDLPAQSRTK